MDELRKLLSLIPVSHRRYFFLLCLFSSFFALVEIIGVGAIVPLISLVTDELVIENNIYHNAAYEFLGAEGFQSYVYILGGLTVVFFLFRAFISYLFVSFTARFSFSIFKYYQEELVKSFLATSYLHHTNNMSLGAFLKVMTKEVTNLTVITSSLMLILSEIMVFILILCLLLYLNYKVTLSVLLLILIVGVFNLKVISKKIHVEGVKRETLEGAIYSVLKEIFLGFKIIKLLPDSRQIKSNFASQVINFSNANIRNQKLQSIPRISLETSGFLALVLIIVLTIASNFNDTETVSMISFFLLALFRILPSINRIISNHHVIVYSLPSIEIITNQLRTPKDRYKKQCVTFAKEIRFHDVSFGYENNKLIFQNLSLKIESGDVIIIKGESGSGKSTLIDLIIGLLSPISGSISVDQRELSGKQTHICNEYISYLDQNIYISSDTIANNVSLGRRRDDKKIKHALKTVLLNSDDTENFPLNYYLGESGAKLSGGQKQRLAIARAIYSDSNLLILDEPTSSLDDFTATEFVKNLISFNTNKTLLIIDHRGHFSKFANKSFILKENGLIVEEYNE